MPDDIIINTGDTPEEELEVPEWQPVLLAQQETNNLLREAISEMRQSNQASSILVPQLLETNQRLTSQLQEMPAALFAVLPSLTQPPLVVTPTLLSDDSLPASLESEPLTEPVTVEDIPPPENLLAVKQPRFRRL